MQTIVRSEREVLLSYISDAHKDAYGFRPSNRYAEYAAMSLDELHAEADRLGAAVWDIV